MSDFSIFAVDHRKHMHCAGCGGCLIDPLRQHWKPAWCIGCRDQIKAGLPDGVQPSWFWETTR